jgi:hypothetical protein
MPLPRIIHRQHEYNEDLGGCIVRHTGGNIMMGKGALYSKSAKQKLNTKSSTEAELVGASDFLPQTHSLNKEFYRSTRIQDRPKRFLPRKHERYANGTQRPLFSRTTIPAHKYQIFLYCRSNLTRRSESRSLPYGHHDSRFFHKTSAGSTICKVQGHHHGNYSFFHP